MLLDTTTVFGDMSINPGIDIRAAMDKYFFTTSSPHGMYVIYRRFDTTRLTEYWDAEKREAIGGPKYEHTDIVYKCRFSWYARTSDPEDMRFLGEAAFREPFVHLRYDTMPKIEDKIFEFATQPSDGFTHSIRRVDYAIQYDIIQVIPYRNLNGRVEFYTCILKEELKT